MSKYINWKIRMKNKAFWLSLIPAALLLIQVTAAVFGYDLDLGNLGNKLLEVVNRGRVPFERYTSPINKQPVPDDKVTFQSGDK